MIWKRYTKSIKTRLITNVILIHAVLMGLVVFDMLEREHEFMKKQLSSKGYDLTAILASNASSALLNNDLVALDELISEMDNISDHYMVFIMDKDGRVRSSQPAEYFNQTLTDSFSRKLIKELEQSQSNAYQQIHSQLIDTLSKVYVDDKVIGYTRTILDARTLLNELQVITNKGLIYIVLATVIGALFAWLSVKTMTTNLHRITQAATAFAKHNFEVKLPSIKSNDEVGSMVKAFGVMQVSLHEYIKANEQIRHYLQNVIDSMPSLLMGVDDQGRITHWNKHAEQFSGFGSEDVMGRKITDVLPVLAPQMTKVNHAIQSRQPHKVERQQYMVKEKSHFADIMIYPLVINSAIGAVIRVDDVTERVRMEEMMMQTEKMMSVGGLAAGMAHEINNPLGGILQGLQNIRRRLSPTMSKNQQVAEELKVDLESVQQYLKKRQILYFMDEASAAAERAAMIVNNMLQFSRRPDAIFNKEDVNSIIEKTLNLAEIDYDLKKKYDFRSVTVERKFASKLPAVPCIASEIQQVLLNLLRNAAQALLPQLEQETSALIAISTHCDGEWVSIEVEDNGPGMPEEIRRRIFEPFFSTRSPGVGTGLGLSVSYFIIHDEHKGDMNVVSTLGKGTKFIIKLPFQRAS